MQPACGGERVPRAVKTLFQQGLKRPLGFRIVDCAGYAHSSGAACAR